MDSLALITGGSAGIGLEYARQLAERGYGLILVSNREEELEEAAKSLREAYPVRVETHFQDLAEHGAAEKLLDWCDENALEPEILINNAGMFFMEYLSAEKIGKVRKMMALHMETPAELSILMGERMKNRGGGHILNMASVTAHIPAPGIVLYSSTKAFLKTFSKSLSYELRPYGVRVTCVNPCAVDTGLYPLPPRLRGFLRSIGLIRSPRSLVRKALRGMFRGKRNVNPDCMNVLLPFLVSLLPDRLIDYLGKKWMN